MAGELREDLLNSLEDLKEEINKINEDTELLLFRAKHTQDLKELQAVQKQLKQLEADLKEDHAEMKEILAKLEEISE